MRCLSPFWIRCRGTALPDSVVPESVQAARGYVSARAKRAESEKRVKKLQAELEAAQVVLSDGVDLEKAALAQVDQSMLINRQTLKVINSVLRSAVSVVSAGGDLPVGCAVLSLLDGKVRVSVAFSRPVFCGWRTEKPTVSYQVQWLQPDVPVPPSENHIPMFKDAIEQEMELACWELGDGVLRLWPAEGDKALTFRLCGAA